MAARSRTTTPVLRTVACYCCGDLRSYCSAFLEQDNDIGPWCKVCDHRLETVELVYPDGEVYRFSQRAEEVFGKQIDEWRQDRRTSTNTKGK